MAIRGPYAKGKAKRAEILDAALEVIDREGYTAATVKELADAVGLSQNGLLHYFGSKDALFAELVRHRDEATAVSVDAYHQDFADDFVGRILRAVDDEGASPGVTQLSLRVAGEATDPEHISHEFMRQRYAGSRFVMYDVVIRLQAEGRIASSIDAEAVATLVFAAWDGLRLQWMYDKSIDIRGRLLYLVAALGIEPTDADERPNGT